jgi:methionyl aminopeptidase
MVNMGAKETRTLDDGWSVVTVDGSLSAHFEHTVAVEAEGCRILTLLESDRDRARQLQAAVVRT